MTTRENLAIRKRIADMERAEQRLLRALHAWEKARSRLRTLEKRLDKKIGGTYDVRELADL